MTIQPTAGQAEGKLRLQYNPYQFAFFKAHKQWLCADGHLFERNNWFDVCPLCKKIGVRRAYHRFLLRAGRRGGKTLCGAIAAALEASKPNTIGAIVTPTYGHIHKFTWPALLTVIPREWLRSPNKPINETYQEMRLVNGSLIVAQSAENPQALRGMGAHWAWFDEPRDTPELAWDVFEPSLTEHRGPCWFTTTPNGEDWVYTRFWQTAENQLPGYWAIQWKTIDNPIISVEEVEAKRAQCSPEMLAQEYEADIVHFTGAIYANLLTSDLVLNDDQAKQLLPDWPKCSDFKAVIGVDPGSATNHPYSAVAIVMTPNAAIVVGEYKEAGGRPNQEHAAAIRGLLPDTIQKRYGIDKRRRQDMIELAQHGIFAVQVGDAVGGDTGSVERVKTWLAQKKLFFWASRCPRLLKEMRSYRWAEDTSKDGQAKRETPFKKDDDLCDALRYALLMWPTLPKDKSPGRIVAGRDLDKDPLPPELESRWMMEQRRDGKLKDAEDRVADESPLYDFWESGADAGFAGSW